MLCKLCFSDTETPMTLPVQFYTCVMAATEFDRGKLYIMYCIVCDTLNTLCIHTYLLVLQP